MKERPRARNSTKSEVVAASTSTWKALETDILRIETESFHPSLADSAEDLRKIVDSPTGILLVVRRATSSGVLGYIAADLLERFPDIPGTASDPHYGKHDTLYVESIAVHPRWRGRGLGTVLARECLRRASERGLERVTAHVERQATTVLGTGARVLRSYDNWYGTGRTYHYIEIPLDRW